MRLPGSYQANDNRRPISGRIFTRQEQGLPDHGFVFCCFNNNHKITPAIFDVWMRILHRVPGSILWLFEENPFAAANLKATAAERSVAPERLVFAQRMPSAEHLARHHLAELVLDTLPYNAHTTASDALWVGVPVLTRLGNSFAGRVAASLLHAVGLPELVTTSDTEYEALAVALATDPDRLQALRARLQANKATAPLFDTVRFTRHLEAAYEAMHARAIAGLPPSDIRVDAEPLAVPPLATTRLHPSA